MNRRDLFKIIVATIPAAFLPVVTVGRKYGHVTVDSAIANGWFPARVLLDGTELEEVVELDDVQGWAIFNVTDESGRPFLNADLDGVVRKRVYGNVVFQPNAGLKAPR